MTALRKLTLGVAAAVAAAGFCGVASAATVIPCTNSAFGACTFDGSTGLFGGTAASKKSVADIFDFTTTSAGSFTFDITSNKLSVSSASFNGTAFSPTFGDSYTFAVKSAGIYALDLTLANATSKQSAFSGTTDFTAAVPRDGDVGYDDHWRRRNRRNDASCSSQVGRPVHY